MSEPDVWCAGCGRRVEAGEISRRWFRVLQPAPRGSEDMRPDLWLFCGMQCLAAWTNAKLAERA